MIPVYVFTNDNHLWLLRGFSYLWNQFCDASHQVVVVGFTPPQFQLPANFRFLSLGQQQPKERWADSLIQFLNSIGHKHFILMLEDYWLTAHVDRIIINRLEQFMADDVLSIDLSGTRASYKQARTIDNVFNYDVVYAPLGTPYQMSFQAAIWNKSNLLKILRPGENPWQSEINGSNRVDAAGLRVLGIRPGAMQYQPVWRSQQRRWHYLERIPSNELAYIKSQGWLSGGI